jgi:hypothetical protein
MATIDTDNGVWNSSRLIHSFNQSERYPKEVGIVFFYSAKASELTHPNGRFRFTTVRVSH